ncbi:MAG TPA: zinc-binding alcohol dehydrogenase family protein [Methylophilaceae bacterium]|nr:zinc-binding alcohol dehydrogenase family protein [Methylophilaceae bacterium]
MKAVGLYRYLPIDNDESLLDLELPRPTPVGYDLLVRIHAVAVNPVDTKVRRPGLRNPADKVETTPKVLGWDAAGEVVTIGSDCTLFKPGDRVFYAGDITRPGSNAEYQLVDERIVGHMPASLGYAQAAALPLTSVTAWESLFDRLGIVLDTKRNLDKSILIIGAAGGVGSIAIQLASNVAGLEVIATASRPESSQWVKELGAKHVINHRGDLAPQMTALDIAPDYILCCNDTDAYFNTMAELIKPQGRICSIVETTQPVDIGLLKNKSASFGWELMFTRPMFKTPDMIEQHHILERMADLVDKGMLRTTLSETLSPINAANLRKAHAQLESGTTIGKVVLSGWE